MTCETFDGFTADDDGVDSIFEFFSFGALLGCYSGRGLGDRSVSFPSFLAGWTVFVRLLTQILLWPRLSVLGHLGVLSFCIVGFRQGTDERLSNILHWAVISFVSFCTIRKGELTTAVAEVMSIGSTLLSLMLSSW